MMWISAQDVQHAQGQFEGQVLLDPQTNTNLYSSNVPEDGGESQQQLLARRRVTMQAGTRRAGAKQPMARRGQIHGHDHGLPPGQPGHDFDAEEYGYVEGDDDLPPSTASQARALTVDYGMKMWHLLPFVVLTDYWTQLWIIALVTMISYWNPHNLGGVLMQNFVQFYVCVLCQSVLFQMVHLGVSVYVCYNMMYTESDLDADNETSVLLRAAEIAYLTGCAANLLSILYRIASMMTTTTRDNRRHTHSIDAHRRRRYD